MPRDGSGVYSAPPGTTATPETTILSTPYNAFVADLVADANEARPIAAGGTGATNAAQARANLGLSDAYLPADGSGQMTGNLDLNGHDIIGAHNINPDGVIGVFNSATHNAPVDGDELLNFHVAGPSLNAPTWTQVKAFLKTYFDGIYAAASALASYLPLTGGTLTGALNIAPAAASALVALKAASNAVRAQLLFYQGGVQFGGFFLNNDATSDLYGFVGDGTTFYNFMQVQRASGNVMFPQSAFITGSSQISGGLNVLGTGVFDNGQRVYSPNNKQFSTNGAVGDYIFALTASAHNFNDSVAGSDLRQSGTGGSTGTGFSGTWRCLGYTPGSAQSTLYQRIA